MSEHAKLSASGSDRWMACTPSARLEEQFPQSTSVFAEEGTFAHAVGERGIAEFLGSKLEDLPADLLHFDNADLRESVQIYIDLAKERITDARARSSDAVVLLERRLDFSPWVPEGFGTGDLITVSDGVITVDDLKFGKGVKVDAEGNSQLRLYGLGAVHMLGHLFDITEVRMSIVQPRMHNISTEVMSVDALLDWAQREVEPKALLAWHGKGIFVAGDHCRFCRARATCGARAEANLELARFDFVKPELLSDEDIADILSKAKLLAKWAGDIEDYALDKAKGGRAWPGWKLVSGKSVRRYSDEQAVIDKLIASLIPVAQIFDQSLHTITSLEKNLGKKQFAEVLGDLIVKQPGRPALVPIEDKRDAINPASLAAADFNVEQES